MIKASPEGPVCHTGKDTCFAEENNHGLEFLHKLEAVIEQRKSSSEDKSYTAQLYSGGIKKISQKVGEEATETILEAMDGNKELFLEESADLVYHLLVLISAQNLCLEDVVKTLEERHRI